MGSWFQVVSEHIRPVRVVHELDPNPLHAVPEESVARACGAPPIAQPDVLDDISFDQVVKGPLTVEGDIDLDIVTGALWLSREVVCKHVTAAANVHHHRMTEMVEDVVFDKTVRGMRKQLHPIAMTASAVVVCMVEIGITEFPTIDG